MGDGALKHDFGGAESFAAVQQRDFGGEAGEEKRFFHCGVAAAHDGNVFASEEEPVASGA